jgi:hypothetical protein
MRDLTFEFRKAQSFGIGVFWNRRSMHDYGWFGIELPFCTLVWEWQPDWEAFDAAYGTGNGEQP